MGRCTDSIVHGIDFIGRAPKYTDNRAGLAWRLSVDMGTDTVTERKISNYWKPLAALLPRPAALQVSSDRPPPGACIMHREISSAANTFQFPSDSCEHVSI
ncbi:hypothetical protein EVAR_77903_1 [Eumeta japonica]|uniref:Uncharacterized protein n=1 Tax=Eumeta variegata TaxID=151549 RepID=A0A4C1ZFV0_EUMVA|nr:hypothetical protein EVAR_77903_1 [Eumeta japonica]